jgi:hypothetical protein
MYETIAGNIFNSPLFFAYARATSNLGTFRAIILKSRFGLIILSQIGFLNENFDYSRVEICWN